MSFEDNPSDDDYNLGLAVEEIKRLQAAIRKHRDTRGDDRCWMDDEELYRSLPEGYNPPAFDTAVEIQNCERFIQCRRNPGTVYVSPQRRIDEQDREIDRLRASESRLYQSLEATAAFLNGTIDEDELARRCGLFNHRRVNSNPIGPQRAMPSSPVKIEAEIRQAEKSLGERNA